MHKIKKVASGLTGGHRNAYEYQSTTWETMLKLLFSYFSEYGILYKHPKGFSLGKGTYIALSDKNFSDISKERINFGVFFWRSATNLESLQKKDKGMKENNLRPFDN